MRGLENVTVMPHCLDHGLGGKGVVRDGRVWVELDVGGERMGGCGDGEGEQEAEKRVRGSWRRGEEGGGRERDRVSMVLPFMLDLETGEEGGEGGEGGEL